MSRQRFGPRLKRQFRSRIVELEGELAGLRRERAGHRAEVERLRRLQQSQADELLALVGEIESVSYHSALLPPKVGPSWAADQELALTPPRRPLTHRDLTVTESMRIEAIERVHLHEVRVLLRNEYFRRFVHLVCPTPGGAVMLALSEEVWREFSRGGSRQVAQFIFQELLDHIRQESQT